MIRGIKVFQHDWNNKSDKAIVHDYVMDLFVIRYSKFTYLKKKYSIHLKHDSHNEMEYSCFKEERSIKSINFRRFVIEMCHVKPSISIENYIFLGNLLRSVCIRTPKD